MLLLGVQHPALVHFDLAATPLLCAFLPADYWSMRQAQLSFVLGEVSSSHCPLAMQGRTPCVTEHANFKEHVMYLKLT
jgi:hypothetical protein